MTEGVKIEREDGKRIQVAEQIADTLNTILSVVAISEVSLYFLGIEVGTGICTLLTLVTVAIIQVVSRRWWILPAAVAVAIVLSMLVLQISGKYEETYEYIIGLVMWIRAAFPLSLPYSENGSIIIVYLGVIIPLSGVMYVYFRKAYIYAILAVLTIILTVVIYYSAPEKMYPYLVLMLGVNLSGLAKRTGRRVQKVLRKRGDEEQRINEGLLQIPAIVIGFVLILFAVVISPKSDGEWYSPSLVRIVEDITDYRNYLGRTGVGGGNFDISQTGYGPAEYLGGDIEPNDDIVLRITTETPSYLTASVYSAYSGNMWYDSGNTGRFRFYSILWRNLRRSAFNLDKPHGGREANRLYTELTETITTRITAAERRTNLFAGGNVISVTDLRGNTLDAYFNLQSELFYDGREHTYNMYMVSAIHFDRGIEDFESKFLRLEELASKGRDAYFDGIYEQYTSLPETLPERVRELGDAITAGEATSYGKAVAIERWISENSEYSFTPGAVPEGRDFVDYFLETGVGYCVYYASAMTVLARSVGLPARYCTGFAMRSNSERNESSYVATNTTAHAWTEIYFKGIGWLRFDPTGIDFDTLVSPAEEEKPEIDVPIIEEIEIPEIIEEEVLPEEIEETEEKAEDKKENEAVRLTLILTVSVFGALISVIIIRIIISYAGSGNYYKRITRKYKGRGAQLDAVYTNIVRLMKTAGIRQEARDTIRTFSERVDTRLNSGFRELCEPVIKYRYNEEEASEKAVRALCEYRIAFEKEMRKEMGTLKYLKWRIISIL